MLCTWVMYEQSTNQITLMAVFGCHCVYKLCSFAVCVCSVLTCFCVITMHACLCVGSIYTIAIWAVTVDHPHHGQLLLYAGRSTPTQTTGTRKRKPSNQSSVGIMQPCKLGAGLFTEPYCKQTDKQAQQPCETCSSSFCLVAKAATVATVPSIGPYTYMI